MGKQIDDAKIAEIQRLALTKCSDREIAEIIGIHRTTAGKHRRRIGLPACITRRPSVRIDDEEIIFLKKIGCTIQEIADMKKMHYQSICIRVANLVKSGHLEPSPRGWIAAGKARHQRVKAESLKKLLALLSENGGVVAIKEVAASGISSNAFLSLRREKIEEFQVIDLTWSGGAHSRGGTLAGGRFIKVGYLGRKFIALRQYNSKERTGLIRFFYKIFKEKPDNKERYDRHDVRSITHWLRRFKLTKAERIAIIRHLGYEYSQTYKETKGLKIKGADRQKEVREMGRTTLKIGNCFVGKAKKCQNNFLIYIPREISEEIEKEHGKEVTTAISKEGKKIIIILDPKISE